MISRKVKVGDYIQSSVGEGQVTYLHAQAEVDAWERGFGAGLQDRKNYRFVTITPEPEPVTHVRYVNVYPSGRMMLHDSRSEADRNAGNARIACIQIRAQEGQYDD